MISFRTRLFLITSLLVGAVLAIVMLLGWSRILAFEVERLDDRLCMEAKRLAMLPPEGEPLRGLEVDLLAKLRLNSVKQLLVRIDSQNVKDNFHSAHWPAAMPVATLNWLPAKQAERPARTGLNDNETPIVTKAPMPAADNCELSTFSDQGRTWRLARFTLPQGNSVIAVDLAATRDELQGAMQAALFWVIPLALLLISLGAWVLASFTMRPLNRLRDAMKNVTQRALDQRLPSDGEDREFSELIAAYNAMLARLEASFQQASRFSADAAHELKTPLTILQGRIEQAINSDEHQSGSLDMTRMLDEVGRLSAITRKLLLLSQADAGRLLIHPAQINLSDLLDELITDTQMLLDGQQLSCTIAPDLLTHGDALLLRQLFNNLISNAVRYCRPDGWITVNANALDTGIEVVFSNAANPISAEDRLRFFDRFFRGDAAHSSEIEGSGLGLSLAREIARAHEGELTLEPSESDVVKLRLWLPKQTQ